MAVAVVGLKEGALVAGNAEPVEAVEDHAGVRLGAALAVGILDPKEEGAAGMTGEEPVEESGPGTADVEVSGGRRREANARRGHWWSTEREGFEPSIGVDPLCRFSKPVPSATRPPLQALRRKQLNPSPPVGGTPVLGTLSQTLRRIGTLDDGS